MADITMETHRTSTANVAQVAMAENVASMIRSNQQYIGNGPTVEIIEQLKCIGELDTLNSGKQTKWLVGLVLSAIALVMSGIGLAMFVDLTLYASVAFIGIVITGIMTVVCGVCWNRAKRMNVQNRRYQIPLNLLQYLKADIPPDRPISLDVGFQHYLKRGFQTEKTGGFFSSQKEYVYEVPWMHLSGQLYDGSKFRLSITQCVKRKEKQKRKRKKITETFRDKYNLNLAVKLSQYPGIASFEKHLVTAQTPAGMSPPKALVNDNRLKVQAMTIPKKVYSVNSTKLDPVKALDADPALQLFLTAYHCLGQCRQV